MFDIYGIIDFRRSLDLLKMRNPFSRYSYYADMRSKEYCIRTKTANIFYLEWEDTSENYCCRDSEHLFIFGSVFSNKHYEALQHQKPKKLNADDVYTLYKKFKNDIVRYIKGSFVLIVFDENKNVLSCISDHLNVLPIYYFFKNGVFIFSSAIKPILDSSSVNATLNEVSIVEFAIFDYTLGKKTYYNDIFQLDYGTILNATASGVEEEKYFSVDRLFQRNLMKKNDSLEALSSLLHENVNLYGSDAEKFLLSLTGGFDGRANLALIDRPAKDFLCYSYGMPGSQQITIPQRIAQRFNIDYQPVYLDRDFEEHYEQCAMKALFYSDGTAPLLRANYPYAYARLKDVARVAVTGLFGSEILRPIHNLGVFFNDNSERLFMGRNFERDMRHVFEHEKQHGYLRPELFNECYGYIKENVWKNYFEPYRDIDTLTRFFFFFIGEGVRKYFMQEIRIERVYVVTRFPYFDFDLVDLMYKTPFAGMYNGALKKSAIKRRRSQLLYAYVMHKYQPLLGEIVTDRGYKPKDLLSRFSYFKVIPRYLRTQWHTRRVGDDTFNSEQWTDIVFSKNRELMETQTDIFPGTLLAKYDSKVNIPENYYFSRMFSLKYWLEKM
jgi:asparagine synthetase B (glutamine-hydrolysing)